MQGDLLGKNLIKLMTKIKKIELVKHVVTSEHMADWQNCKMLTYDPDFAKRKFLESYFINENSNAMNDVVGCNNSVIYNALKQLSYSFNVITVTMFYVSYLFLKKSGLTATRNVK